MSTAKLNKQTLFKDEITVDFLHRSYPEYTQLAEEIALNEICSMQMPIPRFNTLATLNKAEFNRLMTQLHHKYSKDGKMFTIMVAGVIDTFTCMIQNSRFFGSFDKDNTNGLHLMIRLLQSVQYFAGYFHVVGTTQLKVLIDIIEKSAKRIENETECYKAMEEILQTLKTCLVNNENKENDFKKLKANSTKVFNNNCLTKNTRDEMSKNSVLNDNTELKPKLDTDSFGLRIEKPIDLVTKELPHLSTGGDVNKNKQAANAFDVMMKSAKLLTKKRN